MESNRRTDPDRRDEPKQFDRRYRAVVERYENEPHQCTIFPADAGREDQRGAWITAREPTFVDLNEWR